MAMMALVVGLGCSGPQPAPEQPVPATCEGDTIAPLPLARLGATAYERALRSLFGDEAINAIASTQSTFRPVAIGSYDSHLGPVTAGEVEAQFEISSAAALAVMASPAARARLLPCLVDIETQDAAAVKMCVVALADRLGTRALRRALQPEELARFKASYDIGAVDGVVDGFVTLISAIVIDPEFHYFLEFGTTDGHERLSPNEGAARLARILWDDFPDDTLLAAAATGFGAPSWDAEIDRMWTDPRARHALSRFVFDWLELDHVPLPLSVWAPTSNERTALRLATINEVEDFFTEGVFDRAGTYVDLLLDSVARIANPALATIYGVPPDSKDPVVLPAEYGRAGLLTRVGWLSTSVIPGTNAGNLVKRGARLARFLCDEIPLPDPSIAGAIRPVNTRDSPEQPLRERFSRLTKDTPCNGCHATLEAFGAPFGHYGAMGEWIVTESNRVGAVTHAVPIATDAELIIDDVVIPVSDGHDLSERIAASTAGPKCLVEQMVQRLFGRQVQSSDRCLVDRLTLALLPDDSGHPGTIENMIKLALKSPEFWHRAPDPEGIP